MSRIFHISPLNHVSTKVSMDFLRSHLIMNAPLLVDHFPVITFGWVQQQTHLKVMTGTDKGEFIIKEMTS